MGLLGDSEKEDFWATVVDAGFSKEDFELKETGFVTGTVSVRRKSTGVSRQYPAGDQRVWLPTFEIELRGRVFGAP
jgi:hypothetical protein